MADNVKPRVKMPKTAARGEIIEIKTLIAHKMESGQRKDADGNTIPRQIINHFACRYNGEVVFESEWHGAIAANPYMAFRTLATESGELAFLWSDDDGSDTPRPPGSR
ncbi:MAG: thiosulfate oxidation carrier complex protein SoxZ [Rhodospirillales bacterium]|nr:thiosulfate oxidation carrier complex protein SoxZ [Rhodospirillales bacterium]